MLGSNVILGSITVNTHTMASLNHNNYVYLLDENLNVRWAACADTKEEALNRCTGVLLIDQPGSPHQGTPTLVGARWGGEDKKKIQYFCAKAYDEFAESVLWGDNGVTTCVNSRYFQ